jgi:hypothetical protein
VPYRTRKLSQNFIRLSVIVAVTAGLCRCTRNTGPRSSPSGPKITIWYGHEQSFGELGNPQQWVNILGNVSPARVATFTYSLNGRPPVALAVGPSETPSGAPRCPVVRPKPLKERIHLFWKSCRKESFIVCASRYAVLKLDSTLNQDRRNYPRRLYGAGDFNIELDTKLLRAGSNMVAITATDELKHISTASVGVTYTRDRTWPRRYSVKWCCISQPTHVIQIVDGRWTKTGDGFRTLSMGYDRLFAVGDVAWTDFEVTIPITVHATDDRASHNPVSGGPGIGFLVHWRGHSFDEIPACECAQPRCGSPSTGPLIWYDFTLREFQMQGALGAPGVTRAIEINTPYVWRVRSETVPQVHRYYYRMKVWKLGQPEPRQWDIEGLDPRTRSASGSILFDAHHVDATFGDISVIPGPFNDAAK